jgi:cystathionine beta-lyase family protein involved in aluminum resistance
MLHLKAAQLVNQLVQKWNHPVMSQLLRSTHSLTNSPRTRIVQAVLFRHQSKQLVAFRRALLVALWQTAGQQGRDQNMDYESKEQKK